MCDFSKIKKSYHVSEIYEIRSFIAIYDVPDTNRKAKIKISVLDYGIGYGENRYRAEAELECGKAIYSNVCRGTPADAIFELKWWQIATESREPR